MAEKKGIKRNKWEHDNSLSQHRKARRKKANLARRHRKAKGRL